MKRDAANIFDLNKTKSQPHKTGNLEAQTFELEAAWLSRVLLIRWKCYVKNSPDFVFRSTWQIDKYYILTCIIEPKKYPVSVPVSGGTLLLFFLGDLSLSQSETEYVK